MSVTLAVLKDTPTGAVRRTPRKDLTTCGAFTKEAPHSQSLYARLTRTSRGNLCRHDHGPGIDIVPEIFYSANFYTERAVAIAAQHDASQPLWTHLTYQNVSDSVLEGCVRCAELIFGDCFQVHSPYVSPPDWECHAFPEMWDKTFANMVHMLDDGIGNVTAAWKAAGLWDNTLMIFR